jgi:hypothetical protein
VAKETTTVLAFMKERTTQRLDECFSGIDLAWEVAKNKIASLSPFLNGKPLDVNMVSPLSGWFAIVDYLNGRPPLVVLK